LTIDRQLATYTHTHTHTHTVCVRGEEVTGGLSETPFSFKTPGIGYDVLKMI
jgi:hypothetical protein